MAELKKSLDEQAGPGFNETLVRLQKRLEVGGCYDNCACISILTSCAVCYVLCAMCYVLLQGTW